MSLKNNVFIKLATGHNIGLDGKNGVMVFSYNIGVLV